MSMKQRKNQEWGLLFVPDFVSLAYETFFVRTSHVVVQLFVAKEAFMTELAERMYTTLDLLFRHALLWSTLGRGKMGEVLGRRV